MSSRRLIIGLTLVLSLAAMPAQASSSLKMLAEVEPWPAVSRLIGYGDRLWFANSVKGINHNSADLYSYGLNGGDIRYERHLLSQDAGRPVIFNGLLYWPFEDARFSLSYGHVMATDGRNWTENVITTGRIYHTHALAATDHLIAATSAWRAHLDLSFDGGSSWRQVYDHPTPERRVSRIVDLVTLGDKVFGSLVSRDERGLLDLTGPDVDHVPDWPLNRTIWALTSYRDHIYGVVQMANGAAIWRTDGDHSEQVIGLDDVGTGQPAMTARDLIADDDGLWLLMSDEAGGRVWQSDDGRDWTERFDFRGGVGFELARYRGRLFVGGSDRKRKTGLLWGSDGPSGSELTAETATKPLNGPKAKPAGDSDIEWEAAGADLDRLLSEVATYENRARGLRDKVLELTAKNPPPGFFASRLIGTMPDEPMSLIGGAVQIPSMLMGRALLLLGITLQGEEALSESSKGIPLELLRTPWTREPNRAEKYFDTLPFALWAVGSAKQNDRATIDALIDRLTNEEDPLWLTGDVVGALSAITDQRHAYDIEAWRSWWAAEEGLMEAQLRLAVFCRH